MEVRAGEILERRLRAAIAFPEEEGGQEDRALAFGQGHIEVHVENATGSRGGVLLAAGGF